MKSFTVCGFWVDWYLCFISSSSAASSAYFLFCGATGERFNTKKELCDRAFCPIPDIGYELDGECIMVVVGGMVGVLDVALDIYGEPRVDVTSMVEEGTVTMDSLGVNRRYTWNH